MADATSHRGTEARRKASGGRESPGNAALASGGRESPGNAALPGGLRLPLAITLCCIFAVSTGCAARPQTEAAHARLSHKNASEEPPLVGTSGDRMPTLSQDASMKAMALVFVLADCPICNAYVPELNRLHEAFAPRGVGLYVVHVERDITAERATAHATEYGLRPLVALDPDHEWVKRAGASIAPQAVVFSPDGQIVYLGRIDDQYVGLGKRRANVTSHDLRDALEAILANQTPKAARTEAVGCPIPNRTSGE